MNGVMGRGSTREHQGGGWERSFKGGLAERGDADGRYKNGRASDAKICAEIVEEDAVQAAR